MPGIHVGLEAAESGVLLKSRRVESKTGEAVLNACGVERLGAFRPFPSVPLRKIRPLGGCGRLRHFRNTSVVLLWMPSSPAVSNSRRIPLSTSSEAPSDRTGHSKRPLTFGKEGKPRYIQGPDDDSRAIMRKLRPLIERRDADFLGIADL
jgi:hypothetical protein